jgi:LysR family transcriptional regulator, flagellar master operon regulator
MNLSLASTFLEIVRTGSFIAAAEKLYVTQTTITARIHTLEKEIGCKLFIRNRSGASLTAEGQKFIEHATKMVQLWETAKRDLPLPDGTVQVLNIGAEVSLWSPLMLQWLTELKHSGTQLAIRTEIGERHTLMTKLEHGVLDVIVIHQPEYWPGVQVEQLLEEKLIMVNSRQSAEPYIYIDWGEHFHKQHDAALPELARAKLTFNLGPLALQYILENGGSGYFRTRVVEHYIKTGVLEHNTDYPEFTFPVYVMYRKQDKKRYEKEIKSLFDACQIESAWL